MKMYIIDFQGNKITICTDLNKKHESNEKLNSIYETLKCAIVISEQIENVYIITSKSIK